MRSEVQQDTAGCWLVKGCVGDGAGRSRKSHSLSECKCCPLWGQVVFCLAGLCWERSAIHPPRLSDSAGSKGKSKPRAENSALSWLTSASKEDLSVVHAGQCDMVNTPGPQLCMMVCHLQWWSQESWCHRLADSCVVFRKILPSFCCCCYQDSNLKTLHLPGTHCATELCCHLILSSLICFSVHPCISTISRVCPRWQVCAEHFTCIAM